MANEATVHVSIQIRNGNFYYQSPSGQSGYVADVAGSLGPSPGAITVSTDGEDIDFGDLVDPGWCWMVNLDDENPVDIGVWEPDTTTFYPVIRLMPGEPQLVYLSPDLGEEYAGTGTGTGTSTARLRAKAYNAACNVRIEACEA